MKIFAIFLLFQVAFAQNLNFDILNNLIEMNDLINLFPNLFNNTNFNINDMEIILNHIETYHKVMNVITDVENFMRNSSKDNKCYDHLLTFVEALQEKKSWAVKMFDAYAKPQSGILFGNIMHVGNYDECLRVSSENNTFTGKYCTVPIGPKDGPLANPNHKWSGDDLMLLKTSSGFCLPSSCNETNLQPLFNYITQVTNSSILMRIGDLLCSPEENSEINTGVMVGIVIFSTFGLIVILGTSMDLVFKKPPQNVICQVLLAFSFYTNSKKLFSSKTAPGSFNCLNGMRVLSMVWIVIAHSYMYSFLFPNINTIVLPEMVEWWSASLILTGSMAVDTFFVISGLLLSYLYVKNYDRTPLSLFYLHRILRLTPCLIMVMVFSGLLFYQLGSGPFWIVVKESFQENCEVHWWSTLLYLQNYLNPDSTCIPQSWYLAVDTQLYFVSPIFFYFLVRWPKSSLIGMSAIGLASIFYVSHLTWTKNYIATFFNQENTQFKEIYAATHVRVTSWIVGIIFGYIIYKTKETKIKLNKFTVLTLWTICISILVAIVVFHKILSKDVMNTVPENQYYATFYNGFIRPIWSANVCLAIFLCINGYGGIINSFLSCYIFNVLIRLNYSMYLLHMMVLVYFLAQKQTPDFFSNKVRMHEFWGHFMYTLFVSIIWTLTFESPIIILEKMFIGKKASPAAVVQKVESTNGALKGNSLAINFVDNEETNGKCKTIEDNTQANKF